MISFIRTLNKKGPITDPWGTPDVMGCVEELTSQPSHIVFGWIDNFLTTY